MADYITSKISFRRRDGAFGKIAQQAKRPTEAASSSGPQP